MLATIDDVNDVLQLYIKCLDVQQKDIDLIKDGVYKFLYKHVGYDVHVSFIKQNGEAVSMAMMSTYQHTPDKFIPNYSGQFGLLNNIYTLPQYRNQRFASGCVNELIHFANTKCIRYLFSETGNSKLLDVLKFSKINENTYMIDVNG